MDFQFQYKEAIWLLTGIPFFALLFLFLLRWKKRTRKKIGDPRLVKELIRNFSPALFTTKFLLLCLAFTAGVLTVMNLRKPGDSDGVTRKGIDVVVAMDVSKSMLANDLSPNRLTKAKEFINTLVDKMPDDRIALVLFAGKAYLQMPLSTDHNAAKMFVSTADPMTMMQQGTVVSDAMKISALAFNNKERRFKTIVLISDGEDHDMNAIETAKEMAEQGIMINTIGIGSPAGAPIIDTATGEQKKDVSGNIVISKLNEDELKQIASATNGSYIHMENTAETIKELLGHLSQIEKKSFADVSLLNFETYYRWFAGIMFLLLLTEFFIPEKKRVIA
ncbi:MAG: VWA domain-containing protein [Chitinophagaceae bacterium]|nr:MAG: VWA domain-containing protein [Chitinophagaceae bacterium]